MYIKQGFDNHNKWLYGVLIGLMLVTILSESQETSAQAINMLVKQSGELTAFAILLIPFVFLLGGLFFIVRIVHRQSIKKFSTSREKFDYRRLFFAFWVWGGLVSVSVLIDFVVHPNHFDWNFILSDFLVLLFLGVLLIPFQIGFEEYFFRAYTLQGLATFCKNKWFPLFFSSVVFGVAHFANPEVDQYGNSFILLYVLSGLTLGIMTLMDEGLELALGFHMANNLFTALLVTSQWSVFQTPSLLKQTINTDFDNQTILVFVLMQVLILFIFAKKYRWTNWKDKLLGKIDK